ncbi:MAG: hypothetical protein ACRYFU_02675 [Janthinobacterium lividum]
MGAMKASGEPFEITCPDCGGVLKVDPVSRSILTHTSAPKKRTFEDLGAAARALKDQEARRDSLFAQSVQAEKHRDDLMEKRFAEALKKAKESPLTEKPLRDFDLD